MHTNMGRDMDSHSLKTKKNETSVLTKIIVQKPSCFLAPALGRGPKIPVSQATDGATTLGSPYYVLIVFFYFCLFRRVLERKFLSLLNSYSPGIFFFFDKFCIFLTLYFLVFLKVLSEMLQVWAHRFAQI